MKPINFNAIEAIEPGEYKDLPAGPYVCTITAVDDFPGKEYLRVSVDIIQGDFKDFFSDKFYNDKPWAKSSVMSYKDNPTVQGMLKGKLKAITESNPGFDAEAAWNGGDPSKFVGKAVGVVFRQEEYMDDKTGEVKVGKARPDRFVRVDDVIAGKVGVPDVKPLSGGERKRKHVHASYSDTADVYNEDVPF